MRLSPEEARALLDRAGVFAAVAPFDGRFIGSMPLDLHGEGADADIVCSADDLEGFVAAMTAAFGDQPDFRAQTAPYLGRPSSIVRFTLAGLPVEIFARPEPVEAHESFRHHKAAKRLLILGGEPLRDQVRGLKAMGMKTEPAFARALGLEGDAALAMLDLAEAPEFVLAALLRF
jgi:Domain of unknown function (DUF4269)